MLWIYISIKLIKQTNKQTTLKKEIKKKKEKGKKENIFSLGHTYLYKSQISGQLKVLAQILLEIAVLQSRKKV